MSGIGRAWWNYGSQRREWICWRCFRTYLKPVSRCRCGAVGSLVEVNRKLSNKIRLGDDLDQFVGGASYLEEI